MTVFRGFLTILRKSLPISLMYFVIFVGIFILMQKLDNSNQSTNFVRTSLKIGIVDEDNSDLSRGLVDYLEKFNACREYSNDTSVLRDRLFYRDIEYLVVIPKGFEEIASNVNVTKIPGTMAAYYADAQINDYLNGITALKAGGFPTTEATDILLKSADDESNVTLVTSQDKHSEWAAYSYMFRTLPYVIIGMIVYTLGSIMLDFYRPVVRKRTRCSCVGEARMNGEFMLGFCIFGVAIWFAFIVMAAILSGKDFLQDENLVYYVLNAFVLMLVSLAITALVGMLCNKMELLSGIVNIISLGMSFLCGVFIPLELLDKNIIQISRFLPLYWYEQVNNILAENVNINGNLLKTVLGGLGMQLLFAAAFVGIALIVSKTKERARI